MYTLFIPPQCVPQAYPAAIRHAVDRTALAQLGGAFPFTFARVANTLACHPLCCSCRRHHRSSANK